MQGDWKTVSNSDNSVCGARMPRGRSDPAPELPKGFSDYFASGHDIVANNTNESGQ